MLGWRDFGLRCRAAELRGEIMSRLGCRRRWLSFSLRTLFVAVTVFACWLGWELNIVRERKAVHAQIRQYRGAFSTPTKPSWRNRWLGDAEYEAVILRSPVSQAIRDRAKHAFPETVFVYEPDYDPATAR
jgi:hypothetical protein